MSILWMAAALAAAEPEVAAPVQPSVITNPDWAQRPTGQDMARFYPAVAMARNQGGAATIACKVNAEGLLQDCVVTGESPPGSGFGEAALQMSAKFKMRPMQKDGRPVEGGTVRIPIRFLLPEGTMDPLTVVFTCYGETGAQSEKVPTDVEALRAYGFFAAQAAVRSAAAAMPPASFEAALARARAEAIAGRNKYGPTLAVCRGVYNEADRQVAKSAP